MTLPDRSPLDVETGRALLARLLPEGELVSVSLAPGSYSNYTHIVTVRDAKGTELRIVVRRYQVYGDYDRGQKARREFVALQCVCRNDIPAPEPLYLDDTGDLLGIPGIVTRYVSGEQVHLPVDPLAWARMMAQTLAQIHTTPCDSVTRDILLNADAEAAWFLQAEQPPDYMLAHPDGERIWIAMKDFFPKLRSVVPCLVHIDYWSGNVLWEGGQISAVVDWEEAALGDPAIDVAYCRMDMALLGLPQAADQFLRTYEISLGRSLANLGFWELAAAVRPMYNPADWIDQSPNKERFAQFFAGALQRLETEWEANE